MQGYQSKSRPSIHPLAHPLLRQALSHFLCLPLDNLSLRTTVDHLSLLVNGMCSSSHAAKLPLG